MTHSGGGVPAAASSVAPKAVRTLATSAPVRFVHGGRAEARVALAAPDFEQALRSDEALRAAFSKDGELSWIVQTFLRLREAGVGGIELAEQPARHAINILSAFGPATPRAEPDCFCVAVQADFPRLLWAQLHIQQNREAGAPGDPFAWFWPQPGLIARDPARRGVERVAFLGKTHGNLAWDEARWRTALAPLGMTFVAPGPAEWHDFSEVDVAIGIRDFGGRRWNNKPANKMINAWRSGVPFIGGADSAFAQTGVAGVDHLLATGPGAVIEALVRLRDDPEHYAKLVEAGRRKAESFTTAALVDQWIALFEGPVEARYRRWLARPAYERARVAVLAPADSAWRRAKAIARRLIAR